MSGNQPIYVQNVPELLSALAECKGAAHTDIVLREGDYILDSAITLDESYEGVVLRGEGRVRLLGGKKLSDWRPITDSAVLDRLEPEARAHVLVCDLTENGVHDTGRLVSRGFGRKPAPAHAEVFRNGKPMSLSQYPKRGQFLHITGFIEGKMNELEEMAGNKETGFLYEDDRPATWAPSDDLWVHGYWSFDWAQSYERVQSLDLERKHVLTHPPYANYPFRIGQRFYFLNILEEVRYPGDYFIDRSSNLLYFYPEADETAELLISMLETPMLQLNGCRNVSVIGIDFECTRGNGVQSNGADDVRIDRCRFRHIGNTAVQLEGGLRNSVRNSTIYDCGDGGINAFGGDRKTLTPCEFQIANNHIYRIGQWSRCYYPAIHLKGVGIRAEHNLIHDLPHFGIWWWGNEISIEHNEIYSVCMETGDAGAVYAGRDLSCRGNRVSHNFIHHLGGVGLGTMGIYNDDGISGTIMEDNFFLEVGRAAMLGGGVDFAVRNNVFVKCYPAITADSRVAHTKFFWDRAYGTLKKSFYEAAAHWDKDNPSVERLDASRSPYITRYPELAKIDRMFKAEEPMTASAHISQNVFCSKVWFRYFYDMRDENKKQMYEDGQPVTLDAKTMSSVLDARRDLALEWSAGKGSWLFEKNYTAQPSDFEDALWGNIAVREGSEAYEYGYQRKELAAIGLIEAERTDNPVRVRTRLTAPIRGDRKLTLAIRNDGDAAASGVIELFGTDNVQLALRQVPFALSPGEEYVAEVGIAPPADVEFTLEARSQLPGVRPSRA